MEKQLQKSMRCIVCLLLLALQQPLSATTYTIANGDVAGLKAAIIASNTNGKADIINLAPFGTYTLTTVDNTFPTTNNGLPVIDNDVVGTDTFALTINGNGATLTRDLTAPKFRLLYCYGNTNINDLHFTNGDIGSGSKNGGAIEVNGQKYTINNCTFLNNKAGFSGGAINIGTSSIITISNSTFYGNSAPFGGAIYVFGGFKLYLYNTTIAGNTSTATLGCAVENSSTTTYYIYTRSSIISNNTNGVSGADISGAFILQGGSLIGSSNSSSVTAGNPNGSGDYVGTSAAPLDAKLNDPADNGGFTRTMSLQTGSPAINKGSVVYIVAADQRGYARVGAMDIGAYEYNAVVPAPVIATSGLSIIQGPVGSTLTISGVHMTGVTEIKFQGSAAVTSGFTNNTATSVTVVVPAGTTTGQITVKTAAGTSALSAQTFTIGISTGVSLAAIPNVSVYPNPFEGVLTVQLEDYTGAAAGLYTVTGILEKEIVLTEAVTAVNTEELNAGVYVLLVRDAEGNSTSYRLVKQ